MYRYWLTVCQKLKKIQIEVRFKLKKKRTNEMNPVYDYILKSGRQKIKNTACLYESFTIYRTVFPK